MEVLVLLLIAGLLWWLYANRKQSRLDQQRTGSPQSTFGGPNMPSPSLPVTPVVPAHAGATAPSAPWSAALPVQTPARTAAPSTRSAAAAAALADPMMQRAATRGESCWLPQGQPVNVAGFDIAGGWLYVGKNMPGVNDSDPDPALIVPALRVDTKRPEYGGASMGYWPSYSEISPQARAGYLAWLAGGRCATAAPLGFVFLYFYGLERRIVADAQRSPAAAAEVPALLEEVRRLLSIYGDTGSFRHYATELLAVGELRCDTPRSDLPPPANPNRWSSGLPMELRLGLGELVADGKPIPPAWALSWLMWMPDARLRTPAQRCPEEFAELFTAAYTAKYGDGMKLKPNKSKIALSYQPASSGFSYGTAQFSTSLPDVAALTAPAKALMELGEQACTALDPYSRLLGRKPEAAGTAAALALLPSGVSSGGSEDAEKVWAFASERLNGSDVAVVAATELIERWPGSDLAKLPKAEAVLLAQLLERRGFGMEPDPRFGGSPPVAGSTAVLFRRAEPMAAAPSPGFLGAVALLQLAAAVATADGKVSEQEEAMLRAHVIHGLDLNADEQRRLMAHLALVVAQPPTAAALRRKLATLGAEDRVAAGQLLIAVAGADGQVTPDEISALVRLFAALGLDESEVYSQLHSMAVPSSRDALTSARLPGAPAQRFAVPPRPEQPAGVTTPAAAAAPVPTVFLDHALVEAKQHESARVAAMLADIFNDDESEQAAPAANGEAAAVAPAPAAAPAVAPVGGLDSAHSGFVRHLVTRPQWSRAEVEDVAAGLGLMTDGALDAVNEAALEVSGEPLCEGSNPIEINSFAMEEMLR